MLKVDFTRADLKENIFDYADDVKRCHAMLHEKTGKGNDFLGWVEWPNDYDKEEFARILDVQKRMEGKYDTLLVCGIGGSYLGARAALEMIRGLYPSGIEVIFIGNTFSQSYISQVLDHVKDRELVLNVKKFIF